MREAHAHIASFGQSLVMPSLASCASVGECLDAVARAAAALSPGAFLRLHSARIESWDDPRWPTLAELDAAAPRHPCVIMSFDHHAAAANSAALKAAGLTAGQRVEPNGLVLADRATGHASGLLLEQAAYRAWEAAPEPTPAEWRGMVLAALHALAGFGFTHVHDLHSQPWLGPTLATLEQSGELPVQGVWLYPPVASLPAAAADARSWSSPRIRLAGGKLFADGTLNSRTAFMLSAYREPLNNHPRGVAMVTPAQIDDAIRACEAVGGHLAVHAIGDAAVRMVLDAIERTATPRPPGNRHRIEHCELIDEADIPRFARLGVVASVQPCHLLADVEVLTRQLPHRLQRVLPLRDLVDAGCAPGGDDALLWFGSDVPIVRADPDDSLHAATQRRRRGLPQSQAIAWDQRLTFDEARRAFAAPLPAASA